MQARVQPVPRLELNFFFITYYTALNSTIQNSAWILASCSYARISKPFLFYVSGACTNL